MRSKIAVGIAFGVMLLGHSMIFAAEDDKPLPPVPKEYAD